MKINDYVTYTNLRYFTHWFISVLDKDLEAKSFIKHFKNDYDLLVSTVGENPFKVVVKFVRGTIEIIYYYAFAGDMAFMLNSPSVDKKVSSNFAKAIKELPFDRSKSLEKLLDKAMEK